MSDVQCWVGFQSWLMLQGRAALLSTHEHSEETPSEGVSTDCSNSCRFC